jgi:hypothetical protein
LALAGWRRCGRRRSVGALLELAMTPTTQELRTMLEAAAKVSGVEGQWIEATHRYPRGWFRCSNQHEWSPQDDDGDCARMEAALQLDVLWGDYAVLVQSEQSEGSEFYADHNNDRQAARRWASLRAAAACAPKGE